MSEVFGGLVGALGIFLSLALISYHPTDPSWNVVGDTGPAQNWMGRVGASLADALVSPFGIPALVIPIALLLICYGLFYKRGVPSWSILKLLSGGAFGYFLCLLLALYPGQITFRGTPGVLAGGWVGETFIREMVVHLNRGGAYVVVIAGLILTAQLTLRLEIGPLITKLVEAVRRTLGLSVKVTGQAVAAGAGAVGQAAINGASNVGQKLKDEASAWREASERRREEDSMLREQMADAEEIDEALRKTQEIRPKRLFGGLRKKKPETLPEEGESAEFAKVEISGNVTPAAALEAEAQAASAGELEGAEDLAALKETDAHPPAARPAPRARRRPEPAGPKIVKSKYMEENLDESELGSSIRMDEPFTDFKLPTLDFLTKVPYIEGARTEDELISSARTLEAKLRDYGVEGKVVEIHPGPVITMYEYAPAPGVKVSKITNLANDLALALKAMSVRIVAPLPGKAAVGIEVPEPRRQTVYLRDVLEHKEFSRESLKLPVAIGKDIKGKPYAGDLARMPHLLVAGSTGSGKSVAVNAMLISLLYARTPEEVRLILVDPKMIEFSVYNEIPHLLMPVVIEPQKAARALNWAVDEMTRRYQLLTLEGARNISSYNGLMEERLKTWDPETASEEAAPPVKLPYIVIVIDELADLMMVSGKEVQESIVRLAQMARAAGIHMILATQRPSVDVITGLIKANFPARIGFKVSSKTDSRTILDANGAEYLLGNGDMLFLPPGTASLVRLHGAFVSDEESRAVVEHLRQQGQPRYEDSLLASTSEDNDQQVEEEEEYDEKYEAAKMIVLETGVASISTIQRRLKIGYNRSARMVERMAKEGLIGPPTQGGKPREIFASKLHASLR